MNSIEIFWNIPAPDSGLEKEAAAAAEFVLADEKIDNAEIAVMFLDNQAIQQLNRDYRDLDEPTDVLSFPQYSSREELRSELAAADASRKTHLGDIAVSQEYAVMNSELYSVDRKEEILRLVMHGTLHLLGYEHHSIDEKDPMLAGQEALLHRFLLQGRNN